MASMTGGPLSMGVEAIGLDKAIVNVDRMRRIYPDAYAGAIYMTAQNILSTAQKLTPFNTGWLRNSRYATLPVVVGGKFEMEIGFGAIYAIYVHEISANYMVGEWKFLQTAVNWHASTMFDAIASMTAKLAAAGHGLASVPVIHPTAPPHGPPPHQKYRSRKERLKAVTKNRKRIAGESSKSLEAQRAGRPAPRPGRGK